MEEILHHLGCTNKTCQMGYLPYQLVILPDFLNHQLKEKPSKPKQKLQDCLCDSSPFQNGFAHRGAAEASTWLCAEYGESLKYLEETSLIGQVISLKFWKISCWVGLTYHWIWRNTHKSTSLFFSQKKSFLLCLGQMSTCSSSLSSWKFSIFWSFPSKNGSGERLRGRLGGPFPWRCRGRRLLCAAANLGPSSTLRVLCATCHGGSAIGQGSSELHHQCGPWWWCDT